MNDIFTIGDFCFRLICPDRVVPPSNFMKFLGGSCPQYTYTIKLSSDFPVLPGKVLTRREDILVTETKSGESRYIGVRGQAEPYACYVELDEVSAEVYLNPNRINSLNIDPVFSSLLALERRLIRFDSFVLHCAYIEVGGRAILFSAPSETGKTTQANLWETYRSAIAVNGDRALIQKTNGVWYARGWPVCGSSEVCHNRDLPIHAIVVLSQAAEDCAMELPPITAFSRIYSQVTVNRWNRKDHLHAMDLVEQLIQDIPVIHLACTMNESAVIALENKLFPNEEY